MVCYAQNAHNGLRNNLRFFKVSFTSSISIILYTKLTANLRAVINRSRYNRYRYSQHLGHIF